MQDFLTNYIKIFAFSPSPLQQFLRSDGQYIFYFSIVETHKLTSLRSILSTGSPLQPATFEYVYQSIKKDLLLGSITGEQFHILASFPIFSYIYFIYFWEGGPSAWLIFEGPSLKLQWNVIKLNTNIHYRNKS